MQPRHAGRHQFGRGGHRFGFFYLIYLALLLPFDIFFLCAYLMPKMISKNRTPCNLISQKPGRGKFSLRFCVYSCLVCSWGHRIVLEWDKDVEDLLCKVCVSLVQLPVMMVSPSWMNCQCFLFSEHPKNHTGEVQANRFV